VNIRDRFQQELERRFIDHPAGHGIQFKSRRLTNSELRAALISLRGELGELRGVRVVLLLADCLEAYLLYLYLFLEEAVLIPISVQAVGSRIQHICESVQAELIVTNEFLFRAHRTVLVEKYTCLVLRSTTGAASCVLRCERAGRTSSAMRIGATPGKERKAEPVRFIIFTSGSTGTPKGVCLSEQNVLSAADMMVQFLPLDATTLSMVTVPFYDYYGMIQIFGHILGKGAYAFGMNSSVPGPLLAAVGSLGCTDLVLVPYTLTTLLSAPEPSVRSAFGMLKRLTSSSDMLTQAVLEKLFHLSPNITLVNIYGLTEAGRACYRKIKCDMPFSRSIGFPSPGVEIEIRGEANDVGEILIRGSNVMLGYLAGIEAGQIAFKAYDEMATGDLGYFDANGEIILLGRRDHMINLMGMKLHPSEIEMAALKLGVRDAQARVCDRHNEGKVIHLDVVCSDSNITAESIISGMRDSLPRAFVPRTIGFVAAIQRTDVGSKIVR
jgi:acyl-CoA synthetase (AMP-forming)/AMP-acid ligase II